MRPVSGCSRSSGACHGASVTPPRVAHPTISSTTRTNAERRMQPAYALVLASAHADAATPLHLTREVGRVGATPHLLTREVGRVGATPHLLSREVGRVGATPLLGQATLDSIRASATRYRRPN